MKTQVREIRFVAKSALEAAEHVRRELGPDAQVVSVRQVTGTGLQRFLVAPRLEIVAREIEQPGPAESSADEFTEAEEAAESTAPQARPQGPAVYSAKRPSGKTHSSLTCGNLLADAGFSPTLMARLEGVETWREIQELSAEQGLPRAISWLQKYRSTLVKAERPSRLAFLGGPGSGKTTSLCKYLAREVFIHGKQPEVLRMEVDKPHLDNGLSLYCEILGVSCKTDPAEVDFSGDQPVLVDLPGFALNSESEKERIRKALDSIDVSSRVLVLNAANEASVMQRFARDGADLGANFQVLTHIDELMDFGKVWAYVLDLQQEVLFFSNGQNVAGDIIEDTFGFLMERTFPR